jgi:hypothetical protein
MRILHLAAAAAVAVTLAASPAFACCNQGNHQVNVVYGVPPLAGYVPPTGYLLDPNDQVTQVYVVNQGPVFTGPGIYAYSNVWVPTVARPTYSEGGYAVIAPVYPAARTYPYVGYVPRWRCHGYQTSCAPWNAASYRPYGGPPHGAYVYRPAPSARVLYVRPREY